MADAMGGEGDVETGDEDVVGVAHDVLHDGVVASEEAKEPQEASLGGTTRLDVSVPDLDRRPREGRAEGPAAVRPPHRPP